MPKTNVLYYFAVCFIMVRALPKYGKYYKAMPTRPNKHYAAGFVVQCGTVPFPIYFGPPWFDFSSLNIDVMLKYYLVFFSSNKYSICKDVSNHLGTSIFYNLFL